MPITPQPTGGCVGVAVSSWHTGDIGGHPVAELAHGSRADRGQELVTVGEVPVGGVGDHPHHSGRLAEHNAVRAASPGQLEPRGDEPVADARVGTIIVRDHGGDADDVRAYLRTNGE